MQFVLIVKCRKSGASTRCDLPLEEPIVIGRHMESPVPLQGEALSRRHFALSLKAGVLSVQDLSSNGTWLNGIQLRAHTIVRLRPDDLLEVPGYEVRVVQVLPDRKENFPGIRTVPPSRSRGKTRAVTAVVEPREILLIGCVLATLTLLLYAFSG